MVVVVVVIVEAAVVNGKLYVCKGLLPCMILNGF